MSAVGDDVSGATLILTDASSSELVRLLRSGRLDVVLAHLPPSQGLIGRLLRTEPLGIALAPIEKWRETDVLRWSDLDQVHVLAHSRDQASATHDRLVAATELAGARPLWHFRSYTENAAACALASEATASV